MASVFLTELSLQPQYSVSTEQMNLKMNLCDTGCYRPCVLMSMPTAFCFKSPDGLCGGCSGSTQAQYGPCLPFLSCTVALSNEGEGQTPGTIAWN